MRKLRAAVDIGGTFTDLVAYDEDGQELITVKTPSTPPTFIEGVMNVLEKAQIQPEEIVIFKHGSTISTNAIIERRGAKTGMVTTRGFRDVLAAGRANRPDLFNSNWDPSPPLVPRRHILEAGERVDYEGTVIEELNEDDVREAARKFKLARSSRSPSPTSTRSHPDHERRTKEILLEELGRPLRLHLARGPARDPRVRAHLTVAVNAYLGPVMSATSAACVEALGDGFDGELFVSTRPRSRTAPRRRRCRRGSATRARPAA